MKKTKYSEKKIRTILETAYPDKSEQEIEEMVKETMAQYLAETKKGKNPKK